MLGIIAAIFTVLGSAVQAYSAIRQGQAAEAASRYNAQVAEQQSTAARQAAAANAETRRLQLERVLGTQRARYGAAGVIGSEGSPLLTMMQSEEQAALETSRIRYGGELQALGFESEARLQRFQGQQARRQSYLGAMGAILQGTAGAATTYGLLSPRSPASPGASSIMTP